MGQQQERIIVVGGGILTVPAIRIAAEMGLECIVFDGDPEAPGMTIAHCPVVVSTKDPAGAVAHARALHRQAPIAGVVTAGADVEVTVAAIAEALGLCGASSESAYLCHHKGAMRRRLAHANIPGPAFAEVETPAQAEREAAKLGYPLIVKPIDNCGSRGVFRVPSSRELGPAVERALALAQRKTALLEAYIAATTHTVEMIAYRGILHVCSVIDTHHGFDPFAVETRNVNPSQRPQADQDDMISLAMSAVRAVGVDHGPVKVDILFAARGPLVMEMTARLSGGFHCQYTTPLALGTNNIRAAIDVALGRAPRPRDIIPQQRRFAVCQALFPKPGRIARIRGLSEARNLPGIAEIFVLAREGETILPYQSSADRKVFIIAEGASPQVRNAAVREAARTLQIQTIAA